jgi:hypothetical protein
MSATPVRIPSSRANSAGLRRHIAGGQEALTWKWAAPPAGEPAPTGCHRRRFLSASCCQDPGSLTPLLEHHRGPPTSVCIVCNFSGFPCGVRVMMHCAGIEVCRATAALKLSSLAAVRTRAAKTGPQGHARCKLRSVYLQALARVGDQHLSCHVRASLAGSGNLLISGRPPLPM